MSHRLGSVALVCALVACSRPAPSTTDTPPSASRVIPPASTTASDSAAVTPRASVTIASSVPGDCEHLFSRPAGAELLCDENVLATNAEIHWQSYATNEPRVEVNRRYQTLAARCHVDVVTRPPVFSIEQGLTHLSTYEASAADYPTCTTRASPSHRTVILISTMLKR